MLNSKSILERKQKAQEEAAKKLDEFTIEKKELAEVIREVRRDLDERDALYANGDRSGAAKLSSKIRARLKEIESSGKKLEHIQKEKHSKLKAKQKLPGVKIPEEKVACSFTLHIWPTPSVAQRRLSISCH